MLFIAATTEKKTLNTYELSLSNMKFTNSIKTLSVIDTYLYKICIQHIMLRRVFKNSITEIYNTNII